MLFEVVPVEMTNIARTKSAIREPMTHVCHSTYRVSGKKQKSNNKKAPAKIAMTHKLHRQPNCSITTPRIIGEMNGPL